MKVVALHTDFRIYWPARLKAFSLFLSDRNGSLDIIEIAGKGSPYSFAGKNSDNSLNWNILFPDARPEDLNGKIIKPKLFKLLDKIHPDVILAGAIAFPSGALAVQWALANNKRVVIFDDAKIEAVKRNGIVNFIKKSVYSGVSSMFYPAEQWKQTGRFWGFRDEQMFYGVDVVDNDFWTQTIKSNPLDFNYFIAVGRQIPKKNFLPVVQAFHKYLKGINTSEELEFKLILVGEGEVHDAIGQYVKMNNLEKKVILLPFMPQEDLRGLFHHADLLCCNSNNTETWGLVINEAMACGCAIIASNECGAAEVLVKNGVNGFKVSCNDIDGITEAMINYHNLSSKQKEDMHKNSQEIISHWGLSKFCQGAFDACRYAINNPKPKISIISKLIINNWYGRYNPV